MYGLKFQSSVFSAGTANEFASENRLASCRTTRISGLSFVPPAAYAKYRSCPSVEIEGPEESSRNPTRSTPPKAAFGSERVAVQTLIPDLGAFFRLAKTTVS